MKSFIRAMAVLAVSAGVLAGCGGPEGGNTCTTDSDCTAGSQVCHPTAKQCVKSCESASDCPEGQKTCDAFAGASSKICQCSTDALCGGGTGSSNICSTLDKICVVKCSDDSGCASGRKCDTATGQCVASAPSGTPPACTLQSCSGGQICNFETGACEAAKQCTATSAQPDACSYGQYCRDNTCAEVPKFECQNISRHGAAWGHGSTGPIIHEVREFSFGPDAVDCGTQGAQPRMAVEIEVKAYSPSAVFTEDKQQLRNMLHYATADGDHGDVPNVRGLQPSNGGKNIRFIALFCLAPTATTLSVGLHFVGGNEVCAEASR